MSHHINIALSHAALAATGIYCFLEIKNQHFFPPHVTYSIIVFNNVIGFLWWMSDYNTRYGPIFRLTSYSQVLFALPCITTTVWLQNGYSQDWSWAWAIVPIFPLVCYVMDADCDMPMADLILLLNLVGLGVVSFVKELKYGIAATLTYAVAHCCFRKIELRYATWYNFTLCLFAYFSLRAIGFGHDILKRIL